MTKTQAKRLLAARHLNLGSDHYQVVDTLASALLMGADKKDYAAFEAAWLQAEDMLQRWS